MHDQSSDPRVDPTTDPRTDPATNDATNDGTRFNLETFIATWRAQFKYSRQFTDSDLDEMERHMRDQMAELVEAGATLRDAFTEAISEMGGLTRAEDEYAKVHWQLLFHKRSANRNTAFN